MKTSSIALFIAGLALLPSLAQAARASASDAGKGVQSKKATIPATKKPVISKGKKLAVGKSGDQPKVRQPSAEELAYREMRDAYLKKPEVPAKAIALSGQRNAHALLELSAGDYQEELAYTGSRASRVLAAAPTEGKVQKLLWFHGGGQTPNNLIIRRLSRAFAAEGVSIEIHSMNYGEGLQGALEFIEAQPEPILIGGHSMGTSPADMLASTPNPKIKGAILLNGARGDFAVVPTLQLKGSVEDGPAESRNPLVTPVQVMHADHSLRYHSPDGKGPREKDDRNRSVDTWDLNRLVAQQVKAFLETVPEK